MKIQQLTVVVAFKITAPYDYMGIHHVVVTFPSLPNGYEVSSEEIELYGEWCPPHAC